MMALIYIKFMIYKVLQLNLSNKSRCQDLEVCMVFLENTINQTFFFKFESFLDPGSVYKVDLNSFITKTLYKTKLPKAAPDMNDFKTDRLYYKSKDGTRVPMFIIRKKSILKSIYSQPH